MKFKKYTAIYAYAFFLFFHDEIGLIFFFTINIKNKYWKKAIEPFSVDNIAVEMQE